MGTLFRVLSGYYLARAMLRGPLYLLGFLFRRQVNRTARRASRRATRGMR